MTTLPTSLSNLNVTTFNKIYPLLVQKYSTLIPDPNANTLDKINSIIDSLNSVGKLSNDVVDNWNKVMAWVMNDGLNTDVSNKINTMVADGTFNTLFSQYLAPSLGDITKLTTNDKSNLTNALNEVEGNTKTNASQLALLSTNVQSQTDITNAIAKNIPLTLNIGQSVNIASNLTIPSNITLKFNNGGLLNIASGVTLTINGYIDAGFYQIFSFADTTSNVTTHNTSQTWIDRPNISHSVKLDWFGAKGNAYFNWDTNSVYQGNDDSQAIKRAMSFVMAASQKYNPGYLAMTPIIVEARPSASYYVQGDNILGCQDSLSPGICFEFRGNGSVFYHKPLTATDAFINNFGLIYRPHFDHFNVLPFGTVGRIGYFVNSNETTPIGNQGKFDTLIIGQLNYQCGYNNIFNIVSASMLDNMLHINCQYMNFNKVLYNTNPEAMGWLFDKCYLGSSTDNAIYFHNNCNLGGGFEIRNCETLLTNSGTTFLKLQSQSNYELFNIHTRVELQTSVFTFMDIDGGLVEVKGLNMVNGSGGQTGNSLVSAIVRNNGFARFMDSIVSQNIQVDALSGIINGIDEAIEFIRCNFLDNSLSTQQYPVLTFNQSGTSLSQSGLLNSGYTNRKVKVIPYIGKQVDGLVLPVEYGGNTRNTFHIDLIQNQGGKITVNTNKIYLPSYILIKSLKLTQYEKNTANVNKIQLQFFSNAGGAAEYTSTIDLTTYTRGNNAIDGYMITIPANKYLIITYMLNTTAVTTIGNIPNSFIEMEYVTMQSNIEYANREYSSAITLN